MKITLNYIIQKDQQWDFFDEFSYFDISNKHSLKMVK